MNVDKIEYNPKVPIITPATWFMVSIWRGRNLDLNRLITHASPDHQATAPTKNPKVTINPPTKLDTSVAAPVDILNTAKNARI